LQCLLNKILAYVIIIRNWSLFAINLKALVSVRRHHSFESKIVLNNTSMDSVPIKRLRLKIDSNFTWESRILFKYFEYFCFLEISPSPLKSQSLYHKVKNILAKSLCIFTRFFWLCRQVYLILLYMNFFERVHGPLELFEYLELLMFFTAFLTILGFDLMCRSQDFLRSIHPILNLWDSIWNEFQSNYKLHESVKIRKSLMISITALLCHFV